MKLILGSRNVAHSMCIFKGFQNMYGFHIEIKGLKQKKSKNPKFVYN